MYAVAILTTGSPTTELTVVADARRPGQVHERVNVEAGTAADLCGAADRELAALGYTRTGDWTDAGDSMQTATIGRQALGIAGHRGVCGQGLDVGALAL